MKKYCLGFIFDDKFQNVLLLKKLRAPKGVEEMIGKLNGIGGKVEESETSHEAMVRECQEECGLEINNWHLFLTLRARFGHVDCFYSVVTSEFLRGFKQKEDEVLDLYALPESFATNMFLKYFKNYPRMHNIDWMIPMAKNHYSKQDATDSFIVTEIYAPV